MLLKEWAKRAMSDLDYNENADDLVIHLGEMLSFVAFACAVGESWRGHVVVYGGDNTIVKNWLQTRRSGTRGGRLLVRVVNMLEMKFGCTILAGWWRTFHNVDADWITRCTDREFEDYVKQKGWEEVNVENAVKQALEDSERFGPCFLYDMDAEDRRLMVQLKERRLARQIQKEFTVPWESVQVLEWKAEGRSIADFEQVVGELGAQLELRGDGGPLLV